MLSGPFQYKSPGSFENFGSDNGLSPFWCQAIIWTNAGWLIVDRSHGNRFQRNLNQNTFFYTIKYIWIAVCKMMVILSLPRCVNTIQCHVPPSDFTPFGDVNSLMPCSMMNYSFQSENHSWFYPVPNGSANVGAQAMAIWRSGGCCSCVSYLNMWMLWFDLMAIGWWLQWCL